MVHLERGFEPPPKGKGRVVLSVRDPLTERLVAGLGVDDNNLQKMRQICKVLVRERNQFDIARRSNGLFASGRLSKDDADRALKRAMAALGGDV